MTVTPTLLAVTMKDAAYPSNLEPNTLAELIYMWGDTPNPKMPADSTARYKVPCCVRSNPWQTTPDYDASGFIGKLRAGGAPPGVVTVLDLEEAVDPAWVLRYGAILHAAGYLVWPYGSTGFLFQNPRLDGRFVGNPTQVPHLWPGEPACQWGWFGAYDLSLIAAGQDLWDTQPAAPPPPPAKEYKMLTDCVGMAATASGKGYWEVQADGAVFSHGDAVYHGGANDPKTPLAQPIVGIERTPTGLGYWLVAADGGIFSFGDAAFEGSGSG